MGQIFDSFGEISYCLPVLVVNEANEFKTDADRDACCIERILTVYWLRNYVFVSQCIA